MGKCAQKGKENDGGGHISRGFVYDIVAVLTCVCWMCVVLLSPRMCNVRDVLLLYAPFTRT